MKEGNHSAPGHTLAFCLNHGVFADRSVSFGSDTIVELEASQTACPTCFDLCEVLPGTYEVHGDRLSLLLDPSISPEALNALRVIAQRLEREEITPADAQELAKKISPKFGLLFNVSDWSDSAKAQLYGAIICAVAAIVAAKLNAPTIINQPVVERVIERVVTAPPSNKPPLPGLPGGRPLATKPKKRP